MNLSKYLRFAAVLAPVALMSVAACSDSTGPSDGKKITRQEREKLTEVLSNPDVMSALMGGSTPAAGYGVIVSTSVKEIGSLSVEEPNAPANYILGGGIRAAVGVEPGVSGTYRAFASQIDIKFFPEGGSSAAERFQWNGVIAIDNLNTPTRIISAGAVNINVDAPAMPAEVALTSTMSDEAWFGSGTFIRMTGSEVDAVYHSTSGGISFTNATASGSTGCGIGMSAVPGVRSCSFAYGSADVAFNFIAKHTSSAATVTIPIVTAKVPNVKFSVSLEQD